jgi:hypothetical protein
MKSTCAKVRSSLEQAILSSFSSGLGTDPLDASWRELRDIHVKGKKVYFTVQAVGLDYSPFCIVECEEACADPEFISIGKVSKISLSSGALKGAFEDSRQLDKFKNAVFSVNYSEEAKDLLFFERMMRFYDSYKLKDESNSKVTITLWVIMKLGAEKVQAADVLPKPSQEEKQTLTKSFYRSVSSVVVT